MVMVNVRLPKDALARLDAWVSEINSGAPAARRTRTDVIRGLIDEALRTQAGRKGRRHQ